MVEHRTDAGPSRVQNARCESARESVGIQAGDAPVCKEDCGRRIQGKRGGAHQGFVWPGVLVRALLVGMNVER